MIKYEPLVYVYNKRYKDLILKRFKRKWVAKTQYFYITAKNKKSLKLKLKHMHGGDKIYEF